MDNHTRFTAGFGWCGSQWVKVKCNKFYHLTTTIDLSFIFPCNNLCIYCIVTIFTGGPPQQGPPTSGPGSMPGPPGGGPGAPMRGPPPPRPPMGGMPPGGMLCVKNLVFSVEMHSQAVN